MTIKHDDKTQMYAEIHSNNTYGTSSRQLKTFIELLIKDKEIKTFLDFGCGQSTLSDVLAQDLGIKNYKYEPSIKELSTIPVDSVDLVINTDVLEHIPEDILDNVLEEIKSHSETVFFNIHNGLAFEVLSNGENAHCTVYPPEWWKKKLEEHFPTITMLKSPLYNTSSFVTWVPAEETIKEYNELLTATNRENCYHIKTSVKAFFRFNFAPVYLALKKVYRKLKRK